VQGCGGNSRDSGAQKSARPVDCLDLLAGITVCRLKRREIKVLGKVQEKVSKPAKVRGNAVQGVSSM